MRCASNWRHSPKLIALVPVLLLSVACTPARSVRVLPRALPPAPAELFAPAKVLRPPDGTDWEVVAKREQNGRVLANAKLAKAGAWYEDVREAYGK